jgi:hypothetical protein
VSWRPSGATNFDFPASDGGPARGGRADDGSGSDSGDGSAVGRSSVDVGDESAGGGAVVVDVFFTAARDPAGLAVAATGVVSSVDGVESSGDCDRELASDDVVSTMIAGRVVASQPGDGEGACDCSGDVVTRGVVDGRGSGAKVSVTTRTTVNSRCTTPRCSDVIRIPESGS